MEDTTWEENTEPLLGVTALESLGIEIDPLNQQPKRLLAVWQGQVLTLQVGD